MNNDDLIYQIRLFSTVENKPLQPWQDVSKDFYEEKKVAVGERWRYETRVLYTALQGSKPAQPVEAVDDDAALEDLRTQAGSMLTWLETLAKGRELHPDADTHAFHQEPDKTKFRKAGISSAKANASAFVPTLRRLFRLVCDVQHAPRPEATLAHPRPTGDGMVSVIAEDANNYCRILTALGMEEEGDPVAEVERLIAAAYDQGVADAGVTLAAPTGEQAGEVVRTPFGYVQQCVLDRYLSDESGMLEVWKKDGPFACVPIDLAQPCPVGVPDGVSLIAAERLRQVEKEGFDASHDAQYANDAGTLVRAAVAYALYATSSNGARNSARTTVGKSENWPWPANWWKPGADNTHVDRIRELEKSGALIAATIDLLLAAAPEVPRG